MVIIFLHFFTVLTAVAGSATGPLYDASESIHTPFHSVSTEVGQCRPTPLWCWRRVLSVANFKLYLNGIIPYVLICNLLYTAQHTLLRVSQRMLLATVHSFSLLTRIVWDRCTSLYTSATLRHLACFWSLAKIECC